MKPARGVTGVDEDREWGEGGVFVDPSTDGETTIGPDQGVNGCVVH
jgi:hypothetical protein